MARMLYWTSSARTVAPSVVTVRSYRDQGSTVVVPPYPPVSSPVEVACMFSIVTSSSEQVLQYGA